MKRMEKRRGRKESSKIDLEEEVEGHTREINHQCRHLLKGGGKQGQKEPIRRRYEKEKQSLRGRYKG